MVDYTKLLDEAKEARKNSYSPFSGFAVGAALLSEDGRVFRGCNLESAVFSTWSTVLSSIRLFSTSSFSSCMRSDHSFSGGRVL